MSPGKEGIDIRVKQSQAISLYEKRHGQIPIEERKLIRVAVKRALVDGESNAKIGLYTALFGFTGQWPAHRCKTALAAIGLRAPQED